MAPSNSIFSIAPYKWQGLWVFDDPATGLVREAFVAGIDDILDLLTASIPDAENGFVCQFSANRFPGANVTLRHVRADVVAGTKTGNWYWCEQTRSEGWLCPALFRYFDTAPKMIYACFRPRSIRFLPRGRKNNQQTPNDNEEQKN